jgi:hypothetical protein
MVTVFALQRQLRFALYGVAFAGFSLLNVRASDATPAATFKPFCPSIEFGCNAIEL